MIQTDEQLQRTREALADVEASLAALNRRKAEVHPARFVLMAEPILDQIRKLRDQIDQYIGFREAESAVARHV